MYGPAQVLTDCPRCNVASAMVELVDPSERVGVPLEGRCRLCGYATEFGDVVAFGQPFMAADEVIEALGRWAHEDGESDVVVFVAANFNGATLVDVAAAVVAGRRVETGFDVIAWLFPGLQGGGARRGGEDERPRVGDGAGGVPVEPPRRVPAAEAPPPPDAAPIPVPAPTSPDPRDIGRALASIMVADGRIRPSERRFLDEALRRLGAPPLDDVDLRVWRPTELGPVPDPKGLVEAMRLLALCDREADGSELRVLEEFARAWRVTLPRDPLPTRGLMYDLARALRGLLLV